MVHKNLKEGLTFDDILLIPQRSNILPKDVDLSTRFTPKIKLNIPIVSSPMDTVTESRMAIALAREGGIGIIHRNLPIERQAEEVDRVKRSESGVIANPFTLGPEATIGEAEELMSKYHISGVPIVDKGMTLIGILTNRDIRFVEDFQIKVSELSTSKEDLITAPEGTTLEEAQEILHQHRIEKLPLVDKNFKLKGLITVKDLRKKKEFPYATKDDKERLMVGAAVGVGKDLEERVAALFKVELDAIVVDSSHGHSENVIKATRWIKDTYRDLEVISGNVATAEATSDLIAAGADAIRVGMGPGSICTTRLVSGMGVPQITAIFDCTKVASKKNVPTIADGGIRFSGDITKALARGASTVMLGNLLAGTDESPGEIVWDQEKRYKSYRGMGSIAAMKDGSERYPQEFKGVTAKLVPEGVETRVPYKGPLSETIWQLIGGVKSGMGYLGAKDIKTLQERARFIKITPASLSKSHLHGVSITEESSNYR